jgi:hypothetical protein
MLRSPFALDGPWHSKQYFWNKGGGFAPVAIGIGAAVWADIVEGIPARTVRKTAKTFMGLWA